MQNAAYNEIVLFCLAVEILLYIKMRFGMYKLLYQRTFSYVLIFGILSISIDFFMKAVNGPSGLFGPMVNSILHVFYFVITLFMVFSWFRYSGYILKLPFWNDRKRLLLYGMPMFVAIFLLVLSLWNGCVFFVDDFNIYHNSDLYYSIYLPVCSLYTLAGMALAFYKMFQKKYFAERSIYSSASTFGILSIFVIPLHAYFEGELPFLSAGIMLSTTGSFLLAQAHLISVDPLTRLNNRNQLHLYLHSKMKKDSLTKRLYLFVIDLDKFKQINDTFGHNEGDRALELVAEVLRTVCGQRGCFIARFGGDEFNIVAELDNDSQANEICKALQAELHRQAEKLNYPLSLSIGYADHYSGAESLPDFFARADARLYEQKKAKR